MDKMRSPTQKHTKPMHAQSLFKLTVLASVNGLYSSRPPGGADWVTCVTDGSYGRGKVRVSQVKVTTKMPHKITPHSLGQLIDWAGNRKNYVTLLCEGAFLDRVAV